jgi:hypothetical protein
MKRFEYRLILFILVTFFSFINTQGQVLKLSENEYLNNVILEKLKVNPETILEEIQNNPNFGTEIEKITSKNYINSEGNRENLVSGDSAPESELSAAINPKDTNNLIVGVMKQNSSGLFVPIYYSKDFGKTWQKSNFAPMPSRSDIFTLGGGDPVCVFDNNGIAHLTWISLSMKLNAAKNKIDSVLTGMHYAYSTDGGVNWIFDYYKSVSQFAGYSPNQLDISKLKTFDDKQWLAVDLDKNSKYHNNIYISLSRFEMLVSNGAEIVGGVKKAGISAFESSLVPVSKKIKEAHQFSSLSVAKNGRVLITFYGGSKPQSNTVYSSYSDDGGNTYSYPKSISNFNFVNSRLITSDIKDSIIGVDLSRVYPSIYSASDNNPNSPNYGNSYVVWSSYGQKNGSETGFNVYFCVSTNAGETWGTPIELSKNLLPGTQDQFYPTITVNEEGIVIISWYEQGIGGVLSNTNYVVTFSFDGGSTFNKPISANTVPMNFTNIGAKNSKFGIGEYNQMISTKSYAIPVWSDGRDGFGNLNVYAAFIPLQKNVNSIEKIINFSPDGFDFIINPNPASNWISCKLINSKADKSNFRIYDLEGNLLIEGDGNGESFSIDISQVVAGNLFIEIENNGIRAVRKFIKTKN